MGKLLIALVLAFFAMCTTANASLYQFSLENVFIDENAAYPVTGTMTFDSFLGPPSPSGGSFSDINVQAVTPNGTFQFNYMWTTNTGPTTYLGLGPTANPALDDFALIFNFSYDLRESALNGTTNQLVQLGCPTPATTQSPCFGSSFGLLLDVIHGFPETSVLGITGSIVPATPVPLPAAFPLFAVGIAAMSFMGWHRKQATA